MFNLLPQNIKAFVHREFKLRLAVVSVLAFLITIVIAIILLIPAYLFSKALNHDVSLTKEVVETTLASKENSSLKSDLAFAQETLKQLAQDKEAKAISSIFAKIISLKGAGISIVTLDESVLANRQNQVVVVGTASDRDTLLSFQEKIKASTLFSSVNLPVSNFASDKNIQFTMTLLGTF